MNMRGISLKIALEDAGVRDTRPHLAEYHKFASECKAQNPLARPSIGRYVRAVEANKLKLLG